MALKFYMTPGSCSTGIHILLETLELPFEAWISLSSLPWKILSVAQVSEMWCLTPV